MKVSSRSDISVFVAGGGIHVDALTSKCRLVSWFK